MLRLISAAPSPYARKVRIALAEKGIPFELLTEVPWNDDTTVPLYNPLEKLPVLLLEDGGAVYESAFILEWLERMYPEPALMPAGTEDYLAARRYMVLADGVCDAFLIYFFETLRAEEQRSAPWAARQLRKIEGGVAALARVIGDRDYAVGGRLTLADISVVAPLGWFAVRFLTFDWRGRHPNLAQYYDRLEERESFRATVPYPQVLRDRVV
ncbi:MAG: glutathione S-transferase [Acetobacteraceae bacterium]|nr:glutathione S-transferase [Acetobacteraceae bacterium]